MALFTVENLTFSYPGQTARAIDSLSLTVPEGAFLVLCGPSGCGKSTLLRQLKPALAPHGTRQGRILFRDTPLDQVDQRTLAARIGFVQQSPENQIVTDKVWHELAFGLESLGVDTPTIRRRVAEMAAFFGIEDWFYRDVSQLSGGQKQLLNLASVMAMQPDVLILDEPTSQLDPIAASDFLAVLGKINRELGTAVVLTEHRLEEAFPLATAVAVMDRGQLLCTGTPYDVGRRLKALGHRMFLAMPAAMRVWASVETEAPCPVTVREGRDFLRSYAAEHPLVPLPREQTYPRRQPVLTVQGAWFRYEPDSPDVIKGLDLTLGRGEFLALLGGNGAGKSTTLKLLSGMKKPQRGDISVKGTLGMLPQNPQTLFVKKTVREDLFEIFSGTKTPRPQQEERVARMVALCRLEDLLDRHPYDLSGGEQQRAALAKVLLLEPEILLLDEPTKGLDAEFKQAFALILRTLLARGVSLLMVSHDVEFCARYAHRCALFFDGSVVTEASPRAFFSGNSFYTTAANRMARSLEPQAVTAEDVMAVCGGTVPAEPALPEDIPPLPEPREETPDWKPKKLPLWRKALAALSGAGALAIFLYATGVTDLSAAVGKGGLTALGWQQLRLYLVFCGLLLVLALAGTLLFSAFRDKIEHWEYPQRFTEYVEYYAGKYGIDPMILYAFIRTESNFDPNADSDAGARGLMQITEVTFDWIKMKIAPTESLTFDDLYDPETNIRFGSYFVSYCLDRYSGHLATAAAAYHSGVGTVDGLLGQEAYSLDGVTLDHYPYPQMRLYVKKITESYQHYSEIYK